MNSKREENGRYRSLLTWVGVIVVLSMLTGCVPSLNDLEAVDYTPLARDDWEVSTPAAQGVDPMLLAKLYYNAAELETLYGLLVIKDGYLIAERYFNGSSVDHFSDRQSATKSFTSALVGVALDQGCLTSVDQRMMDFFPEFADQIADPRKNEITVRHLLQMRSGYPDEEYTPPYFDILFFSEPWPYAMLQHLVGIPLTSDPGTKFAYSNLTSHLLGVVVARACGTDLMSLAQEHLFSPMGAAVGDWWFDADGYNAGWFGINLTARNMAKFGLLYLNDGEYEGTQLLSADWVRDSKRRYSENIKRGGGITSRYGSFRDIGYGFQWWSARVGGHHFDYAAGHGGNYIILLDELDMIIVTAADPLHDKWDENPWQYEGAINNLVGDFIKSLP